MNRMRINNSQASYFSHVLLVGMIFLLIGGCGKDDDAVVESTDNRISGQLDGVFWKSQTTDASYTTNGIVISGFSSDNSEVSIIIRGDSAGSYQFGPESQHIAIFRDVAVDNSTTHTTASASGAGSVSIETIDEVNRTLTGSFAFTAERLSDESLVSMANGVFTKLKYKITSDEGAFNTMSANIAGDNWVSYNTDGFVTFGILNITGLDADGIKAIKFQIPLETLAGSYDLDYFGSYKATYVRSDGEEFIAKSGTLTIDEHNEATKVMSASFDMLVWQPGSGSSLNISSGEFYVAYQ